MSKWFTVNNFNRSGLNVVSLWLDCVVPELSTGGGTGCPCVWVHPQGSGLWPRLSGLQDSSWSTATAAVVGLVLCCWTDITLSEVLCSDLSLSSLASLDNLALNWPPVVISLGVWPVLSCRRQVRHKTPLLGQALQSCSFKFRINNVNTCTREHRPCLQCLSTSMKMD